MKEVSDNSNVVSGAWVNKGFSTSLFELVKNNFRTNKKVNDHIGTVQKVVETI